MHTDQVKVWDPFIRLFHWSLVGLFVLSYLTGDDYEQIHSYSGYALVILIGMRVIWGLIGSYHARFSHFIRRPSEALHYLLGLIDGSAPRTLGHNPAGGWMVIALLSSLLLTGLTGLLTYGADGHGPLATMMAPTAKIAAAQPVAPIQSRSRYNDYDHESEPDREDREEFWEDIHEAAANFTILLILLHLLGVLASSLAHGENLARAMVTGRKRR